MFLVVCHSSSIFLLPPTHFFKLRFFFFPLIFKFVLTSNSFHFSCSLTRSYPCTTMVTVSDCVATLPLWNLHFSSSFNSRIEGQDCSSSSSNSPGCRPSLISIRGGAGCLLEDARHSQHWMLLLLESL